MAHGKNKEAIVCATLQKYLYGFLIIALLLYLKLLWGLEGLVFIMNPYDTCGDNKVINGKHITITWNINYLKISHAEESEVTKAIE